MAYSQQRNIFVKQDVKLTEPPDAEPHVRWCERSAAKTASYSIYEDTHYELCKDYIWLYEHSTEIIDAIKNSRNPGEMTIELKEKYGLSDYQIKKLFQIRLDMLTTEKYEECKCEMARIEDARKQRADGSMGNKIGYKGYVWRKLSEAQLKKEELEAYMIAAENAVEIVKLMEEN